jgi:hypothetical protein
LFKSGVGGSPLPGFDLQSAIELITMAVENKLIGYFCYKEKI